MQHLYSYVTTYNMHSFEFYQYVPRPDYATKVCF